MCVLHAVLPTAWIQTSPRVQHRLLGHDDVDLAVDRGGGPEISVQPLSEVRDGAVPARQEDVRVQLWSQRCRTTEKG